MAFVEPVTLRERGVRLEPLDASHEAGLRAAAADGELWKLRITSVPEPENTGKYIDDALRMRADGNRFAFAVVDDTTGTVLGTTSYHDILPTVKRVEIGYTWYAKSHQKTTVNTECKLLLLSYLFDSLAVIAVEFRTHWHNQASRAAIARLGAKQDGVLRNHQKNADGSYRDTMVFSIIDHEWPMVKKNLGYKLRQVRDE